MSAKTYEVKPDPPDPMPWDAYERIVQHEWTTLLNREPPPAEQQIQSFLEQHPCLIPGAFSLGSRSGHHPYPCAVIAQAPLPSYNHRVPDFLWLSKSSELEQPVLIEIEAPGKRWWTQKGQPTAYLTHALNQITEWKAWFNASHNVLTFKSFYGLDREAWLGRTFRPAYALIYGRRAEANATATLTTKRANMRGEDVVLMTYDSPDAEGGEFFCVKKEGNDFRAISVPPTMTWNPYLARDRADIRDKETAIAANQHLTPERRTFLLERAAYWDTWAARTDRGSMSLGDRE